MEEDPCAGEMEDNCADWVKDLYSGAIEYPCVGRVEYPCIGKIDDPCVARMQGNVLAKMRSIRVPANIQIKFYMRLEAKRLGMRNSDYFDFLLKLYRCILAHETDEKEKEKRLKEFWGI